MLISLKHGKKIRIFYTLSDAHPQIVPVLVLFCLFFSQRKQDDIQVWTQHEGEYTA